MELMMVNGLTCADSINMIKFTEEYIMPTISKKELEDYKQLCKDRNEGKILTPNGLKLICRACNYNPEEIGRQMLENMAKICNNK